MLELVCLHLAFCRLDARSSRFTHAVCHTFAMFSIAMRSFLSLSFTQCKQWAVCVRVLNTGIANRPACLKRKQKNLFTMRPRFLLRSLDRTCVALALMWFYTTKKWGLPLMQLIWIVIDWPNHRRHGNSINVCYYLQISALIDRGEFRVSRLFGISMR